MAVHIGGAEWWGLRRGGVFTGPWFFGGATGEAGGGSADGPGGLWRRGALSPVGSAAVCGLQRLGRVRAGTGTVGEESRAGGEWCVVHRCGCQGAANCRVGGLSGSGGGVPDRGPTRGPGTAAASTGRLRRARRRPDGPVGHGQWSPGAGECCGGAGGGPGRPGRGIAGGGQASFDGGVAAVPGGRIGATAACRSIAPSPSAALPLRGTGWGTAVGGAAGLGGGGWEALSGLDGGPVPHGAGGGVRGPVGR